MKYTVKLKCTEDHNGEWGLLPLNSIHIDNPFDALWNAEGVFHDVFEHYFEDNHKYFLGYNSFCLWGEMCASGHALAYSDLGVEPFSKRRGNPRRNFTIDTMSYLEDAYLDECNIYSFDENLLKIPYQKYDYDTFGLEDTICDYISQARKLGIKAKLPKLNRISEEGIRKTYRYGYKQANKIIGKDQKDSYNKLVSFLDYWDRIVKTNNPKFLGIEESELGLNYIQFNIENKGELKIKTYLVENCTGKKYSINNLIQY